MASPKSNPKTAAAVARLALEGKTYTEISKELKIGRGTAWRYAQMQGIQVVRGVNQHVTGKKVVVRPAREGINYAGFAAHLKW